MPYTFLSTLSLAAFILLAFAGSIRASSLNVRFPEGLISEDLGTPFQNVYPTSRRRAGSIWEMQRTLDEDRIYLGYGHTADDFGQRVTLTYIDTQTNEVVPEVQIEDVMVGDIQMARNGNLHIPQLDDPANNPTGPGFIRRQDSGEWFFPSNASAAHFESFFGHVFREGTPQELYQIFYYTQFMNRSTDGGVTWNSIGAGFLNPTSQKMFSIKDRVYFGGTFAVDDPLFGTSQLKVTNSNNSGFTSTGLTRDQMFPDGTASTQPTVVEYADQAVYIGSSGNANRAWTVQNYNPHLYVLRDNQHPDETTTNISIKPLPASTIAQDLITHDDDLYVLGNIPYRAAFATRSFREQARVKNSYGFLRAMFWRKWDFSSAYKGTYSFWDPQTINNTELTSDYYYRFYALIEETAPFQLAIRWPQRSGTSDQTKCEVYRNNQLIDTFSIDQTTGFDQWNSYQTYNFESGDLFELRYVADTVARDVIVVDAMRLTSATTGSEIIVDEADRQYIAHILKATDTDLSSFETVIKFPMENMARTFEFANGAFYVAQGNTVTDDLNSPASQIGQIFRLNVNADTNDADGDGVSDQVEISVGRDPDQIDTVGLPFTDDFDRTPQSLAFDSGKWTLRQIEGSAAIVNGGPASSSGALSLVDATIEQHFESPEENTLWTHFDVRPAFLAFDAPLPSIANSAKVAIAFQQPKKLHVRDGNGWASFSDLSFIEEDTWYRVSIFMNSATGQYAVWLDDKFIGNEFEFTDGSDTSLSVFQLQNLGDSEALFDNFILTTEADDSVDRSPGYTSWTEQYPDLSARAFDDDPDRDGLSNWIEYAINTDPTSRTNPTSSVWPFQLSNEAAQNLSMFLAKNPSAFDVDYFIDHTEDLQTEWLEIDGQTPQFDYLETDAQIQLVFPRDDVGFFRLRAEPSIK